MQVQANGLSIEVDDTGEAQRPAVLLVMGMGMQLTAWPQALVDALHGQGWRVVRFDNRDCGLSQQLSGLGVPNLVAQSVRQRLGLPVHPPYGLADMAADALGVLDTLQIRQAHVVGVSMGGMVGQHLALAAPHRVLSLASIMSSSGAAYLPGARPHVLSALLAAPASHDEEALVAHAMRLLRLIGSPAFPQDEDAVRERVRAALRRSYTPHGTARQMAAVVADTARADRLGTLRLPTLVVHGLSDPLVPFACGHDTARRIPGARLVPVPGMGHDLPPGVVERLLQALVPHLRQTAPQ